MKLKLHRFKVGCAFGLNKQRDEIEFEMPEDATEEQIQKEAEQLAWEWASEQLDCWAEKIQADGDSTAT